MLSALPYFFIALVSSLEPASFDSARLSSTSRANSIGPGEAGRETNLTHRRRPRGQVLRRGRGSGNVHGKASLEPGPREGKKVNSRPVNDFPLRDSCCLLARVLVNEH